MPERPRQPRPGAVPASPDDDAARPRPGAPAPRRAGHPAATPVTAPRPAWAAEGEEFTVDLDPGRFLCVRADGPADGNPLVLLTGLGFDLHTWPPALVRVLAGRGHRVLRFDNRDVGRSFRVATPTPTVRQLLGGDLPAEQYTVEDMAGDVAAALDVLGVQRSDVLGFSLGGMIAQSLAAHHPHLVQRLVSLCSTTGDPTAGGAAASTAAMLALPGARTRRTYVRSRLVMARHLAGTGFPVDLDHERELARTHWDRSLDPRQEGAALRRQIGAIRASGNRGEALARITAPTLVLHGDRDRIVRPDGGPATARAIPGACFVRVPGMGHQVHPLLVPRLARLVSEHLAPVIEPRRHGHHAAPLGAGTRDTKDTTTLSERG
ncbi:alpha/beta fold hydrolase [Kocuria sp.]|uniref:alpha/beta fold hydrolase n=1 Tax=Kocuria sp. TaxID=1871328 RepID=UPI0026DD678F|nr:alpha/beta fold hydrolase [Kocuria sp.]MDO4918940.1 alpha/beta fold hydrolase [Kocuria sp.]